MHDMGSTVYSSGMATVELICETYFGFGKWSRWWRGCALSSRCVWQSQQWSG